MEFKNSLYDNATINGQIESVEKALKIVLQGSNEVTCTNSLFPAAISVNNASLVIEGSGALKATSAPITDGSSTYSSAIMVTGDLTIEGGTITAIGSDAFAASCGINVENGNIYIKGGTVYTNCALEDGSIVAKSGEVTSGFSVGIYISGGSGDNGDIIVSGGTVYAYGGTASGVASGIASWRNIIIDGGTVTAFGGTSEYANNYGIGAPGTLTINGGTVNATGGTTAMNSFGVGAEGDISITGGDINAIGGTAGNLSHGVGTEGNISITGGDINATGGEAGKLSYGVGAEGNISISGGELTANTGAAPYAFGIGTKKSLSITDKSKVISYGTGQSVGAEEGYTIEKHCVYAGDSAEDALELDSIPTKFASYKYFKALPIYTVTVNNGTGAGEYLEGATVVVTANPTETGKQFKEWVAESGDVTFASATSSETSFTMPEGDVVVTATYQDEEVGVPQIIAHPASVTVDAGSTASFWIEATGDGLSYQWKVNKNDGNGWTDISGATQTSYTTQSVDKDWDGFQYKCVVSNSAGSVESDTATLHVNDKSSNNGGNNGDNDENNDNDDTDNIGNNNANNSNNTASDNNNTDNSNVDNSNHSTATGTEGNNDVPKTGVETPIGGLFAIMFASGAGIVGIRKKKKVSEG